MPLPTRERPLAPAAWAPVARPAARLRVGIDYRTALRPNPTGVGRYVRDLVAQLAAGDRGQDYLLLHDRRGQAAPGAEGTMSVATGLPALRCTSLRAVWEEVWLPATLGRLGLDVFHGPTALLPFALPRRVAAVITVHDFVYRVLPETMDAIHLQRLRTSAGFALRRADAIIAVSQHTARDLEQLYGVADERVTVAYPAVDDSFRPLPIAAARRLVAHRYGVARPFLLYVGGLGPRKNVGTLLRAYLELRQTWPGELDCVVVGDTKGAADLRAFAAAHGLQRVVHFPEYVPDADLPALYSACTVYAYASLYEGFGLPVLEAMRCGAPVVCSNSSSLPEVAGAAAVLVDPTDVGGWLAALRAVLESPEHRAALRAAGQQQAARFTLAAEAAVVQQAYAHAAERAARRRVR